MSNHAGSVLGLNPETYFSLQGWLYGKYPFSPYPNHIYTNLYIKATALIYPITKCEKQKRVRRED